MNRSLTQMLIMLFFALILAAPLTACNTMSGMGEDVEAAGEALEEEAEEASY